MISTGDGRLRALPGEGAGRGENVRFWEQCLWGFEFLKGELFHS